MVKLPDVVYFFIGVALAVGSTIFIGGSFIIKKKALLHAADSGGVRPSAGGFNYLKEWMWWAGLISMGIGELSNFAAYAFAPASVVTPLGALSILVTAILATKFLDEELNLIGKIGCFLCILGSVIIVIHAPNEAEAENVGDLLNRIQDPIFIIYLAAVLSVSLFCGCYLGPRFGNTNVFVYITVCSFTGSLTVMGCKGLALSIRETLEGNVTYWTHWQPWIFLVMVVICIVVQMVYLNKALDVFNTGIVTPVYYVMFTTMVLVASAILFEEWVNLSAKDIVSNICGFLVVVIAVILLNTFKDNNAAGRSVWRPNSNHGNSDESAERSRIRQSNSRLSSYSVS